MNHYRYLILGGGPSGLAFAHSLMDRGEESFLVVEKEAVAGGLCRSLEVDNAPLDIGGGHFLDVRRQDVLDFVFRFLPADEWVRHDRVARICLRRQEIDHPLEANLWQLPRADQVDFLESIARSGSVHGEPMPNSFRDWVRWKFGDRIADEYMVPYNEKIWSIDLEQLGTYWLHKLPEVSFRDTLRSCLEGKAFGMLPAHGVFLYPQRHGYGEVWKRMGEALGQRLVLGCAVTSIDPETGTVNGLWQGETIISTIPWTLWPAIAPVPESIARSMRELKHAAVDVDYHPESLATPAHWIYDPRSEVPYHRILVRHNFCPGSRGHWTEANSLRSEPSSGFRHHNEYAYPVSTRGKPDVIRAVLEWARGKNIIGLGRWGTWEHVNSDVAVDLGIGLARTLTGNN